MFTSAAAYDRFVGRYGPTLAVALLDFAGLREGRRALDVGCGTGALLAVLAGRVDDPVGVEPSAPFAAAARARVPAATVHEAGAEALPLPDGHFDAVLSQLVLNFIGDAPRGVAEMRRVTRPGGIVAGCVWDYGGGMTLLRAFWDAARDVLPEAAAADEGKVMRWCTPAELDTLWQGAGLTDIRTQALEARAAYDSFDDLWAPLEAGVGPAGVFCARLAPDARAAVRHRVRERLAVTGEPFELSARAWAVSGRVG